MNKRNAILAAVIGVAVVAAATGGILLMDSGSNTADVNSEGSSDIRPTGPAGTVSSVEINSASLNRSNASAFTELQAWLNTTLRDPGLPDFLMKIAVTNNRADNVTLNGSGFVAVLDDDTTARAVNNMSMTIEPNVTAFPVLGFVTSGKEVRSVGYDNGSISFTVTMMPHPDVELPGMVTSKAPTGNLTPVENLTFKDLAVWEIDLFGEAPLSLWFDNGSVVLVLLTATNNNTTGVSIDASDFWLDVGNGTWVRGDIAINNNVPSQLANNTTVPFLVGFRIAENMTVNGSVFYWPDEGDRGNEIPLRMENMSIGDPALALMAIWNVNATEDGNMTNATLNTTLQIELVVIGNSSASDMTNMTVWTKRSGTVNVTPEVGVGNRSLNVTVELANDDDVTMLSYNVGTETKYIWLRPLSIST